LTNEIWDRAFHDQLSAISYQLSAISYQLRAFGVNSQGFAGSGVYTFGEVFDGGEERETG
jgi:hypothetical protein